MISADDADGDFDDDDDCILSTTSSNSKAATTPVDGTFPSVNTDPEPEFRGVFFLAAIY